MFVEKYIREEFLPAEYHIINQSEIENLKYPTPFGRRYASHYAANWSTDDAYLRAYIGYDRVTGDLIGGEIRIYIKDPKLKGRSLAEKFLSHVPEEGWKSAGPKVLGVVKKYESEISSVIWSEGVIFKNKVYLEVISISCLDPDCSCYVSENLFGKYTELGIVIVYLFLPNNPFYNNLEEIQEGGLLVWGDSAGGSDEVGQV
jgi:hypothetical protein